jgi:hypothetical protein
MVRADAFKAATEVPRAMRRLLRDDGFDLGVLYVGGRAPYAPRGPRGHRPVEALEARFET